MAFPTALHRRVADLAYDFFMANATVDTVLVVNSCARGVASPDSDLDMAVLVGKTASAQIVSELEAAWRLYKAGQPLVIEFEKSSAFAHVHVDVFDGQFTAAMWDEGGGPDTFEIEIGNRIAHAAPLHGSGSRFQQLQARWLPYYDEAMRDSRLKMVLVAAARDLDHVPFFLSRGLHFQAFDRLYKAFQEFLQGLFIARRIYPVAYNKWIREQVEDWLQLPQLYRELPPILSVRDLASSELAANARALRVLLERWTATG